MTKHPRVSVVLPVYNAEAYLESAVRSVLDQTFQDFEVLLMDDGSSDGSLGILQAFARQDSRCIVHTRENRGLVATLNEGIGYARGELIARMDADDLCLPERFERQVAFLDQNPDCVALGTSAWLIDAEGDRIAERFLPRTHGEIDQAHLRGEGGAIYHPAVMIRASSVRSVGGYRQEYRHAEDFDLFLRMAEIGTLANLPEVLFCYRIHLTSVGIAQRAAQVESTRLALADTWLRRGLAGDPPRPEAPAASTASPVLGVCRRLGWWAYQGGTPKVAWKYVRKIWSLEPWSPDAVKLAYCLVRDRVLGRRSAGSRP